MSKRVVAVQNHTDEKVYISGRASGKTYKDFPDPNIAIGKGRHAMEFDIPDNSDSAKYWNDNNISVLVMNQYQNLLDYITFWDDDYDNFKIKYCKQKGIPQPADTRLMRGGDQGGNRAKVAIHVFENPKGSGQYELTAVRITAHEERKRIASSFKAFAATVGMSAGAKHTPEQIRQFMQHPAFQSVKESALEGGYQSTALVTGGGANLGVGVEVLRGVLTDSKGQSYYEMTSTALSIGAEEGIAAFIGIYMSTEPAAKVGGLEFFEEVAADLGIGVALRVFTSFWGGSGIAILFTAGEELELSVGLGETSTTQIS